MKLAIMQPYFLPYIGYWQLINAVDKFVIYDNIQYTKKGWINRNRILNADKDIYITIPLDKDSDYLAVDQRNISRNFDRIKLLNQVSQYYRKAPNFKIGLSLFEEIIMNNDKNLFKFIFNSIEVICAYLSIETPLIASSSIDISHDLKGQDKVLSICKQLRANEYINPIGGVDLYKREVFKAENIELKFLQTQVFEYYQNRNEFIPHLSILDVIMFNSKENIGLFLKEYRTI